MEFFVKSKVEKFQMENDGIVFELETLKFVGIFFFFCDSKTELRILIRECYGECEFTFTSLIICNLIEFLF